MSVCEVCGKEMHKAKGCVQINLFRIRYGNEKRMGFPKEEFKQRCHDCKCYLGEYHHPGCDVEECPVCGKQKIGCECLEIRALGKQRRRMLEAL